MLTGSQSHGQWLDSSYYWITFLNHVCSGTIRNGKESPINFHGLFLCARLSIFIRREAKRREQCRFILRYLDRRRGVVGKDHS